MQQYLLSQSSHALPASGVQLCDLAAGTEDPYPVEGVDP
jgi:hypothetical protein